MGILSLFLVNRGPGFVENKGNEKLKVYEKDLFDI